MEELEFLKIDKYDLDTLNNAQVGATLNFAD